MVGKTSRKCRTRPVTLVDLVSDWLSSRPKSNWKIERLRNISIITGYRRWFGIYDNYVTAGCGVDSRGNRWNSYLLLEAADPDFFKKLGLALDTSAQCSSGELPFATWRRLGLRGTSSAAEDYLRPSSD